MYHQMYGPSFISHLKTLGRIFFFLLLTPVCTGQPQTVVATVGEDVILPCLLEPAKDISSYTLEWARPDLNPRFVHVQRSRHELVEKKHKFFEGRTSMFMSELKHGNISLKLSKVRMSDEGTYKCFIPLLSKEYLVQLIVASDAASSPVITLAGINRDKGGLEFQCESAGWYPKPEVLWLDGEGKLLSAGPTEIIRGPDGLFTVSSRVTVEKSSNNFTCRVQQENVNRPKERHVQVPDDFFRVSTSSDVPIIAGLAVSLSVCILLILAAGGFFMWKQKQNFSKRKEAKRKSVTESTKLLDKVEALMEENKKLTAENQQMEEQLQEEKSKISQLEKKLQEEKTQRDESEKVLQSEIDQMKEQLQEKEKQLEESKKKNDQMEEQLQEEKSKISQLEKKLQAEKTQRDESEKVLQSEIDQMKEQLQEKEKQLEESQEKNDQMEEQLQQEKRQKEESEEYLQSKISQMEEQLQAEKTRRDKSEKVLQSEIDQRKKKLQEKEKLEESQEKNDQLEKQLQEKENQLEESQEKMKASQSEGGGLQSSSDHSGRQRSSSSDSKTSIPDVTVEVDKDGRFIRLRNESRQDIPLGGRELRVLINKNKSVYRFDGSVRVEAGGSITLWRPSSAPNNLFTNEFVWSGLPYWNPRDQLDVNLCDSSSSV